VTTLALDPVKARGALTAFRLSCPSLVRREDLSGLVPAADWQSACDAARGWPEADAVRFFESQFDTLQVGEGSAFATGYFEPEIAGSRSRTERYQTPIYGKPTDLVEADLGLFGEEWKGKKIRGRVDNGQLLLYPDRAGIEDGALSGRGLEIAWAADPVDLFFLHIQGSGRLRLPDGTVMRIGYASQNGRDYTGIGRVLRERGLLAPGQASMQGITAWLRANPEQGRALMRENQSYVFFRELTGPGPLGALGYAVAARTSVAADPKFIPLGAPVWIDAEHDIADGLWVAQDTGGAIKGANRFDTFWGAGEEAARIAGGMSSRGQALILVPRGTFARLSQRGGG
jgi:membrane-bound lytic murein transglycosylase A